MARRRSVCNGQAKIAGFMLLLAADVTFTLAGRPVKSVLFRRSSSICCPKASWRRCCYNMLELFTHAGHSARLSCRRLHAEWRAEPEPCCHLCLMGAECCASDAGSCRPYPLCRLCRICRHRLCHLCLRHPLQMKLSPSSSSPRTALQNHINFMK